MLSLSLSQPLVHSSSFLPGADVRSVTTVAESGLPRCPGGVRYVYQSNAHSTVTKLNLSITIVNKGFAFYIIIIIYSVCVGVGENVFVPEKKGTKEV
jgi:hypothetical protein